MSAFRAQLLAVLVLVHASFKGVVRQSRRRLDQGGHAEGHRGGGGLRALLVDGRVAASILPDGDQARDGAQEAHRAAPR